MSPPVRTGNSMQDIQTNLDSEIGALNTVVVHRPGREIENMTPASAAEVLYDDILNLELATREHDQLTGVLRRVADVYEFEDLLRDTLADGLSLIHISEPTRPNAPSRMPSSA